MIDYTKRGVIVLGSARSGSHMLCDMLFHASYCANKKYIGEVTSIPYIESKFIFCSLVQFSPKNLLAVNVDWVRDYHIIKLRRRNKVSQYISWCAFRAQTISSITKHSPNWEDYKHLMPWESTPQDIENFINEQHIDYAFPSDETLYYEDVVLSGMHTNFKKNQYPMAPEKMVTDYALVEKMLGNYSYDGR